MHSKKNQEKSYIHIMIMISFLKEKVLNSNSYDIFNIDQENKFDGIFL